MSRVQNASNSKITEKNNDSDVKIVNIAVSVNTLKFETFPSKIMTSYSTYRIQRNCKWVYYAMFVRRTWHFITWENVYTSNEIDITLKLKLSLSYTRCFYLFPHSHPSLLISSHSLLLGHLRSLENRCNLYTSLWNLGTTDSNLLNGAKAG